MKKVLFILGELSDDDIDWLVETGSRVEVETGTVLIQEGHPVDTLYILLEGILAVSVAALEGKEIAQLTSGDVVGEMSFVDARPPSATVQARERSLVLAVSRAILAEKLQADVGFASRFYRALAILLSNRLRGTVQQMGDSKEKAPAAEIDASLAESMEIAKARFDWMLRRLRNGEIEP